MMITTKQFNQADISGSINTKSHDTLGQIYFPPEFNSTNFDNYMFVMEKERNGACTVNEFLDRKKNVSRRSCNYNSSITDKAGDGITFLSPVAKKLQANLKKVVESSQKKDLFENYSDSDDHEDSAYDCEDGDYGTIDREHYKKEINRLVNSFIDSGRIDDKNVLKLHGLVKNQTSRVKRGLPKDEDKDGEYREGMFSFLGDEKKNSRKKIQKFQR